MKPEIHLFILWENARVRQEQILADIKSYFTILKQYSVKWSPSMIASNFTRFCGTRLGSNLPYKISDCGIGEFLVVIVRDDNPIYEMRDTFHGSVSVNTKMYDAKQRYRNWTGGGIRVHATDNTIETNHDLALLLGQNAEQYVLKIPILGVECLSKDLEGAHGWTWQQLTFVLKNTAPFIKYVEHDDFWLIINMPFTYKVIRKIKKEWAKMLGKRL